MPIKEYQCSECGHRFDVLQRLGEDGSGVTCPKCGASKPEKMLSAFASGGGTSSGSYTPSSAGNCSSGFG